LSGETKKVEQAISVHRVYKKEKMHPAEKVRNVSNENCYRLLQWGERCGDSGYVFLTS
jgi:hypothetical protein